MYATETYSLLPRNLKSLATQYCFKTLMKEAAATKMSELYCTLNKLQWRIPTTQKEIVQGWWYEKQKGEPFKSTKKMSELKRDFPCSWRALNHPLWEILGIIDWADPRQLAETTTQLKTNISRYSVHIDQQGPQFKKNAVRNVQYIERYYSLDAIAAVISIFLYLRYAQKTNEGLTYIQELCFDQLIRLFSAEEVVANQFQLFNAIKIVFLDVESGPDNSIFLNEPIPYLFGHIESELELQELLILYSLLIQLSGGTLDSESSKRLQLPLLRYVNSLGELPLKLYSHIKSFRKPH